MKKIKVLYWIMGLLLVAAIAMIVFRVAFLFDIAIITMIVEFIAAIVLVIVVTKKRKRAYHPVFTTGKWEDFMEGVTQSLTEAGFAAEKKGIRLAARKIQAHCFYQLNRKKRHGLVCSSVILLENVSTMQNIRELEPKLEETVAEWILQQKQGKADLWQVICFVQDQYNPAVKQFCCQPGYSYPFYNTVMVAYERSTGNLVYLSGNDFAKPGFLEMQQLVDEHLASGKAYHTVEG